MTIDEIGNKAFFVGRPSFSHGCKVSLAKYKKNNADQIVELKRRTRCNHCHKKGHWEKECNKKNQDE